VPDDLPEGWYVPIQRSVTKPDHVGGVSFGFAVMLGTFTLALTLGGQKYWVLPFAVLAYVIAVAACKHDPYLFEKLKEHIHTKSYYGV